jgi:hypothetical protein
MRGGGASGGQFGRLWTSVRITIGCGVAGSDKISGSQQIAENGDTIDMDTLNLDSKSHDLGMDL